MLSSAWASCTSFPRLTERVVWSLVLAGIMPFCPSASFRGLLSSACKTRPPNFSSVAQRGKCTLNTTAIQFRTDVPSPVNLTSVTPLKPAPLLEPLLYLAPGKRPFLVPTCGPLHLSCPLQCICKSFLLISSSPFKNHLCFILTRWVYVGQGVHVWVNR